MFELSIIIYLVVGIIVPIVIFAKNYSNSKNTEKETKTWMSFVKTIGYSLIYICIIAMVAGYYETVISSTIPDSCVNAGGWVYSCVGDKKVVFISLSIIFIFSLIHYKLCEREIYKLKGISQYVLLILYLVFVTYISMVLFFILGGLFITIHYDSKFLELFRLIVIFLPVSLFALSIYWKELKGKILKQEL